MALPAGTLHTDISGASAMAERPSAGQQGSSQLAGSQAHLLRRDRLVDGDAERPPIQRLQLHHRATQCLYEGQPAQARGSKGTAAEQAACSQEWVGLPGCRCLQAVRQEQCTAMPTCNTACGPCQPLRPAPRPPARHPHPVPQGPLRCGQAHCQPKHRRDEAQAHLWVYTRSLPSRRNTGCGFSCSTKTMSAAMRPGFSSPEQATRPPSQEAEEERGTVRQDAAGRGVGAAAALAGR